jgi:hypothetical protein
MDSYAPPVQALLTLGRPEGLAGDEDVPPYDIGPEQIPELIRLLRDEELADGPEPECYAQIHAWRALAQLRAEAAIEPLLDLLGFQAEMADWNEWITEEVPRVLGMIGPAALAPTIARLERRGQQEWPSTYFTGTLTEIAQRHPDQRAAVVDQLSRVLGTALSNHPGVNGSVIADLVELKAVETWPTIEAAFATANVDEFIVGDAADVKYLLGFGSQPVHDTRTRWLPPTTNRPTAKQRFNDRMAKKKAEKKQRKQERKRK